MNSIGELGEKIVEMLPDVARSTGRASGQLCISSSLLVPLQFAFVRFFVYVPHGDTSAAGLGTPCSVASANDSV
jgi:hypothetical protein